MKRFILEQSSEEFYTCRSGLALVGACINRHSDLSRQVGRLAKEGDRIAEIDVLRSYLGLLCLGKSDYQAMPQCGRTTILSKPLASALSLRPSGCGSVSMSPGLVLSRQLIVARELTKQPLLFAQIQATMPSTPWSP
nr:hypothetical protein [uncultured Desulfobulbus sp.]